MLRIVVEVKAPGWAAQGVKEVLAGFLERFGTARVISVSEAAPVPDTSRR